MCVFFQQAIVHGGNSLGRLPRRGSTFVFNRSFVRNSVLYQQVIVRIYEILFFLQQEIVHGNFNVFPLSSKTIEYFSLID